MTATPRTFDDRLVDPATPELPAGFFDRFVFNCHPVDATEPSVLIGFGLYPGKRVVDGFVIVTEGKQQRNLRFDAPLVADRVDACGPFGFAVVEPDVCWTLRLTANPIDVEFDLIWRARTPRWWKHIVVENSSDRTTSFDHLVQSGRYEGTLTIGGTTQRVDGWWGQRDRSRGVRTMSGGQGLHIWFQAQFPEFSIGFLLVESRTGERILLEGAVMHESGELDEIADVRHALDVTADLDMRHGVVRVATVAGHVYTVRADGSAGGGFLAGAGYGGHHGTSHGVEHVESDTYQLDGSISPRTLDSALTDRLCAFELDGVRGSGIFEFAFTRSTSYTYSPTL